MAKKRIPTPQEALDDCLSGREDDRLNLAACERRVRDLEGGEEIALLEEIRDELRPKRKIKYPKSRKSQYGGVVEGLREIARRLRPVDDGELQGWILRQRELNVTEDRFVNNPPVGTQFTFTGGSAPVRVAQYNPSRGMLAINLFAAPTNASAIVHAAPYKLPGGSGFKTSLFQLLAAVNSEVSDTLLMTRLMHGVLCQAEWWVEFDGSPIDNAVCNVSEQIW